MNDAGAASHGNFATYVEGAARHAIAECLEGDLALRRHSLPSALGSRVLPTIYYVRGFNLRIGFQAYATTQRKIFWIPVGGERDRKVADLRVKAHLTPARQVPRRTNPVKSLSVGFPRFAYDANRPDTIQFTGGRKRKVHTTKNKNGGLDFTNDAGKTFNPSAEDWIAFLFQIVEWQRQREEIQVQVSVDADPEADREGSVDLHAKHLSGSIVRAYDRVRESLRDANGGVVAGGMGTRQSQLAELNESLAGPFDFADLRADVLVHLDDEARLVTKAGATDAQQIDLRTWLDPQDPGHVRLQLRLSDLVSHGPLWEGMKRDIASDPRALQQITVALRAWAEWQSRQRRGDRHVPHRGEDARAFVQRAMAQGNVIFMRLRERPIADEELIWLKSTFKGRVLQYLLRADFRMSRYPDVALQGTARWDVVAEKIDDRRWVWAPRSGRRHLKRSLGRTMKILLHWREVGSGE